MKVKTVVRVCSCGKVARNGGKQCDSCAQIKSRYGLTFDEYANMKVVQKSRCKVCGRITTQLSVDHNHTTGKIRGLLCTGCNNALGFIENKYLLEAALAYLAETDGEAVSTFKENDPKVG